MNMRIQGRTLLTGMVALLSIACGGNSTAAGTGTMTVQLTDAPFPSDSVSRVDIFVVRVDARVADADSATATKGAPDDSARVDGWITLVRPNASVNLLAYQNGAVLPLGDVALAAGTYRGFRLVIDPSKSSLTLKNGAVLTNTSSPSISFPSAARSGIKIVLTTPVTITANRTTVLLVDFMVANSFVMRGNSISQNGLLFLPVVKATAR